MQVKVIGYPAEKNLRGQLYGMMGDAEIKYTHKKTRLNKLITYNNIDATSGQGGCPVFRVINTDIKENNDEKDEHNIYDSLDEIIGINIGGKKQINFATLLNDELIEWIDSKIHNNEKKKSIFSVFDGLFSAKTITTSMFEQQFIYKRAQEMEYNVGKNGLSNPIHNIGVVVCDYGDWCQKFTGFIFKRSKLLYVLTEGNAVVPNPDSVSFHLKKNLDDNGNLLMASKEISKYQGIRWAAHPKYLKEQLQEFNVAIIVIDDPKMELNKVKPLRIEKSSSMNKHNKAKVFGFGGIWGTELFGTKGDIICSSDVIFYETIISRGRGGPIFGFDEKTNYAYNAKSEHESTVFSLLNMGLDLDSIIASLNIKNNECLHNIYESIYQKGSYKPSTKDKQIYNKKDNNYYDTFNNFGSEKVIGISLGTYGLPLHFKLFQWIMSYE
eukprot:411149_1